jgi:hypothetical protein
MVGYMFCMPQILEEKSVREPASDFEKANLLCEILSSGGKCMDSRLPAFQKNFKH